MKILLSGVVLLAALASAAQDAPRPTPPPAMAPIRPAQPNSSASLAPALRTTQTFRDAQLHLTFVYPVELRPMELGELPGAARSARNGDHDADSNNLLTGRCSQVLLSVGETGAGRAHDAWGSILLVTIEPGCLPAKALKSRRAMDNLLNPLVSGATQILGMASEGPATTWPVQGYRVHFAEAEGQPVVKSDLQPSESDQTLAVLAVQAGDRVLAWKFESNNQGLLNRMLASRVDFGQGTPQPLIPLQIPSGP